MKKLLCSILVLTVFFCEAQEIDVRGGFLGDSIKIGIVVPYTLSASYNRNQTIVFPDSTYSFAPFEIDHKVYFPTRSTAETSYDSVVYYLSTFEIDSIQRLKLPVFVVHPQDCTAIFADEDSVFLQQLIAQVPDSLSIEDLPLKTNTAYHAVSWLLNYPLLLIAGGILIVVVIVGWLVFGKRIRKYFALRRLNRNHKRFNEEFGHSVNQLKQGFSTQLAESTLLIWKQYMERLTSSPITKYTSKEIFHLLHDQSLADALKKIDKTIYRESSQLEQEPLLELQRFSQDQFKQKVEELKNG
ncbi:MAG: hypothetical protein AB7O48_03650 [Cyclobacteriaceae bacterium]